MTSKIGNLKEVIKQYYNDLNNPTPRILTGFKNLDDEIRGIRLGDFILIAGRTGGHKSTLCSNIVLNAARNGTPCGVYSYEMSSLYVLRRMMCSEMKLKLNDIESLSYYNTNNQMIDDGLESLSEYPIELIDKGFQTIDDLVKDIERKKAAGISLFIVDYVQLIRTKRSSNRTEQMEEISGRLRETARENDVTVVGISQFSRKQKSDEEEELSDMKGSSALEFDAAQAIFIRVKNYHKLLKGREGNVYIPPYREAKLILKKNRHGQGELESDCLVVPNLYKFLNVDLSDSLSANADFNCSSNFSCNSDVLHYANGQFTCSKCKYIYSEPCTCNEGLVYYNKIQNGIEYIYAGFCASCARGESISNAVKSTNSIIANETDKITFLPYVPAITYSASEGDNEI